MRKRLKPPGGAHWEATLADLITGPNLDQTDIAYCEIIDAHRGLSDEASSELNARLVLILANHIGDIETLRQALALARKDLVDGDT